MNLSDLPPEAWVAIASIAAAALTAAVGIFAPLFAARLQREHAERQRASDEKAAFIDRALTYHGEMRSAYASVLVASAEFRSTLESSVRVLQDGCTDKQALAARDRVTAALAGLTAACATSTLIRDDSLTSRLLSRPSASDTLRKLRESAVLAGDRALVYEERDEEERLAVIANYAKDEERAAADLARVLSAHLSNLPGTDAE